MALKVLGERILVQEIKQTNKTVSGIVIPGKEKESTNKGKVIGVGDGAYLENGDKVAMEVKVGDIVYYSAYSGSPIVEDLKLGAVNKEEDFLVLNQRDILAVIVED